MNARAPAAFRRNHEYFVIFIPDSVFRKTTPETASGYIFHKRKLIFDVLSVDGIGFNLPDTVFSLQTDPARQAAVVLILPEQTPSLYFDVTFGGDPVNMSVELLHGRKGRLA